MSKFLRESESGFDRIDTEAGVIYGVKVLGPKSRNGRIYEDAAIRRAVPMYGVKRLEASMASAKKADKRVAKSPDEARNKYIGTGSNKAKVTPLNKMKPKAQGKGLFPGLLTGNYKGKKITKGTVAGKGYFKS